MVVGVHCATQLLTRWCWHGVQQSKMLSFSAAKSQRDIGSYFDSLPTQQQLSSYSAKKSEQDMDSYFDSLPGQSSHAVLGARLGRAAKVSDDGLPVLPKNKRAHSHSHSHAHAAAPHGHKELGNDGLPVLPKKGKDKATENFEKEHETNKAQLQAYKFENPSFKQKLDKVHEQWMTKHDNLPASKSEKKEYDKLVLKVFGKSIGDVVRKGVEEPRPPASVIKAQVAKAQAKFARHHKMG